MRDNEDFHSAVSSEALERWPTSHRPWNFKLGEKWRLGFLVGANWARLFTLRQVNTDAESLIDTRDGLALANAAWKEGLSAGIRECNSEGAWSKPVSPYSAPLLAIIAAEKADRRG